MSAAAPSFAPVTAAAAATPAAAATANNSPSDIPSCCQPTSLDATANPYAKGGLRGQFVEEIVSGNSYSARLPAHRLYAKIVNNILQHPTETKYRRLNVEKVISKFGTGFKGIAELMRSVGFVSEGDNLVLPESTPTAALCQSLCVWTDREVRSAAGRAEAERVRQQNQAEIAAMQAAKSASRAQVKTLSSEARKDVASKPINSSVGNQIKFGSTLGKVPPPPAPAKGG